MNKREQEAIQAKIVLMDKLDELEKEHTMNGEFKSNRDQVMYTYKADKLVKEFESKYPDPNVPDSEWDITIGFVVGGIIALIMLYLFYWFLINF